MNTETTITLKDNTANPAPLGLIGFGMTTILLNLHNAGFFELNAVIISMGIFVGGIAQLIAGIQEWKKNNTFGATAFTSYGAFWLSLVCIWLLPNTAAGASFKSSANGVGCYLLVWGVYSLFMFIGTLKINRALQVVFASLTVLFFLLAMSDFMANESIKTVAAYVGIFCGSCAFYTAMAQVINEVHGKTVLPLGGAKH